MASPGSPGANPYAAIAQQPGMYQGSGYNDAAHPGGPPQGHPGQGPPGGPDNSYMQYTEGNQEKQTEAIEKIDAETGIAPRRMTDCVLLPIFLGYILAMVVIVWVARSHGQTNRLTRGFDYQGRLCGYDRDIHGEVLGDFLYWCRSSSLETGSTPAALNLRNPICLSECPQGPSEQYECLMEDQIRVSSGPETSFTVRTLFVHSEQSMMLTHSYETKLFGGRYCMPKDRNLRAAILNPFFGPVNFSVVFMDSFGSFQDCWPILFCACILAVVLGYGYIYAMKCIGRWVLYFSLWGTLVFNFLFGIYFLCAILTLFAPDPMEPYMKMQPFFEHLPRYEATICSVVAGVFLFGCSMSTAMMLYRVESTHVQLEDLIDITNDCLFSNTGTRWLFLPPAIDAIIKYFLMMLLCTNFMYLVSVGWIDSHRIVINDIRYLGASKVFVYDTRMWPWILFYLYGSVWIFEVTIGLQQFIIAYVVILWYYLKKPKESHDHDAPWPLKVPVFHALHVASTYHLGTILLTSAMNPWLRFVRILEYLTINIPQPISAEDHGDRPDCFLRGIECFLSLLCTPLNFLNVNPSAGKKGWDENNIFQRVSKNVYTDTIIRSNHLGPASRRAVTIIKSSKAVMTMTGELQPITITGVASIATVCSSVTWWMTTCISIFNDPRGGWYIQSPFVVALIAYCLCGSIAYSFMALLDQTADTILYCYSYNKKYKKGTCQQYMPDDLANIVGNDHLHTDTFPFYGDHVNPNMYLGTFMGSAHGHGH